MFTLSIVTFVSAPVFATYLQPAHSGVRALAWSHHLTELDIVVLVCVCVVL